VRAGAGIGTSGSTGGSSEYPLGALGPATRCASAAASRNTRPFKMAANQMVCFRPSSGSSVNPVSSAPTTAPAVLMA
jgi:hypothetical protein